MVILYEPALCQVHAATKYSHFFLLEMLTFLISDEGEKVVKY